MEPGIVPDQALTLVYELEALDKDYRFVLCRLYRVGAEKPIGRIVPEPDGTWFPELWRFSESADGYAWERATTNGVSLEHALKVLWFNRHGAGE